jgi:aminoglycoside phosphotransferase (APT) family kinase protein
MQSTATISTSLVPTLADVVNKRVRHAATNLQVGDQLHFTAPVLGFPKGGVAGIYGYCVYTDEQGQVYAVTAYVRGGIHAVPYTEREARRYPAANQREQWFGSVLMYLTEIDLTDYADCLRLERLSERVTPLLPAAITSDYRQAA